MPRFYQGLLPALVQVRDCRVFFVFVLCLFCCCFLFGGGWLMYQETAWVAHLPVN